MANKYTNIYYKNITQQIEFDEQAVKLNNSTRKRQKCLTVEIDITKGLIRVFTEKLPEQLLIILKKVFCHEKCVKPLAAVQAYLAEDRLRFSVDRVALKDWSPILRAIAENRSLSKICIYSRSRRRKIREKINTAEKLEKFWRCRRKGRARPILFTNFLCRCLVDSVAVSARDSSTITSITLDGIPLAAKYLNILCWGLRDNEKLRNLSLARCRIGDFGCNLLLGCLMNVPNLCVLNLSSCRLTNRSATFLSLFLKRKKADLLQNVWEKSSLRSFEGNTCNKVRSLHTLILSKNPKFGDNGVQQLTHAMKSDFSLKYLNLKHCGITKHGGEIIIKFLQSSTSITKMDLTENHIPINTLQMIFRILKRKRESIENTMSKKKLILHWKYSQNKIFQNKNCKFPKKSGKYSIHRSNRMNRRSMQNRRLKTVRFDRKIGQTKRKENEKESEKKNNSRRDKLCDLETQLLSIIESNCKLKEKLLSNKALLNVEAQETLRMEDELQKISSRLNDIRNKVVMLSRVSSKTSSENQLINGLRHAFEKVQGFSIATRIDVKEEIVLNETETT